jgi:hypothetical protein
MSDTLNQHGSFLVQTPEGGYINVNPELSPEPSDVSPTGRYHVFYAHPERGSCTFVVEQDENCTWVSEHKPPFVTGEFVEWIGDRIECNSK